MNARSRGTGSSIAVAALFGALGAVMLLPHARSTAAAQVELALGRRPDWMRAASGGSSARLKQVLAAHPDDVKLQVGAATLLPSGSDSQDANDGSVSTWKPDNAVVLQRLQSLAERFPSDAAIRAHQLRYLVPHAVHIRRPGDPERIGPPLPRAAGATSGPPAAVALRAFAAAAAAGGELEPNNGFFDAMAAVGEFAAGREQEALRHLHTAAGKPHWDDHAVDETPAQWKLLQSAYGDHGALQRLPASYNLALGHFGQILAAAKLAVSHAAQREQAGDLATALAIRHDVIQLGMTMAEARPGVIGKWISLELVDAGFSSIPPDSLLPTQDPRERYERFLRAHGAAVEADWVHAESARADALRERLGRTYAPEQMYDPLLLVAWWIFDVILLRQAAGLMLLWGVAALLGRARGRVLDESRLRATLKWIVVSLAVFLTPIAMGAAVGAVRLDEGTIDGDPILRLIASVLVLWSGSVLIARLGDRDARFARSVKVLRWLSVSLGLVMLPFVVMAIAGPELGSCGPLGVGTVMVGMLALARRAGRRVQQTERPSRWQPGLVTLICVAVSSLLLFLSSLFLSSFLTQWSGQWDSALGRIAGFNLPVIMPGLVPALLLMFAALCRVAALDLPLRAGLPRVARQMAPSAMALLALVYIAALVPTLAGDRATQHNLDQELARNTSYSQPMR